jgi:hypothetical protein
LAGFGGIAAVGTSLQRFLNAAFAEQQPIPNRTSRAVLVRTSDFEPQNVASLIGSNALTIFLYRVDFDKTMRAAWSSVGAQTGRGHLVLDLHYLLTPWADNAEFEHLILGRAMQAIEATPIFSGPLLDPAGGWATAESIQLVLEDISTEAVMRTFDSLPTDYRVSVPYIARVVRIDTAITPEPFVTTAIANPVPEVAP